MDIIDIVQTLKGFNLKKCNIFQQIFTIIKNNKFLHYFSEFKM
jgi:hypothetical protein